MGVSRRAIVLFAALPLAALVQLPAHAGYWCSSPGAFGDCVDDPYVYTGGDEGDWGYKPHKPDHKPPHKPPHKPDHPYPHHPHHPGPGPGPGPGHPDDSDPTYRQYSMPSSIVQGPNGAVSTAVCEGDMDNRDSAVGVNGQDLPPGPGVLFEGGRPIGYSMDQPFVLTCEDNHTAPHDFDL